MSNGPGQGDSAIVTPMEGDVVVPTDRDGFDLGWFNLTCAVGLAGAEGLDVGRMVRRLDAWAGETYGYTEHHIHQFHRDPSRFDGRIGYWRMLALTSALQRRMGMRYNPALIDRDAAWDWRDSSDLMIHGLLGERRTGTCASIPMLITAIGRRMGYPLRLVRTREHLFCRWDEPGGERFNIECHGNGMLSHSDDYYRQWPRVWPAVLHRIEAERGERRVYLRSLTESEEMAECLSQRGHCLSAHGRRDEAIEAYGKAEALVPDDPLYRSYREAAEGYGQARPRWYDPTVGEFIEEDPIGFAGGDPNLYAYVGNHPTGLTDPSGLSAESGTANWGGFASSISSVATSLSQAASPWLGALNAVSFMADPVMDAYAAAKDPAPGWSLYDPNAVPVFDLPQVVQDRYFDAQFGKDYRTPAEKRVDVLLDFRERKDDPDTPYTIFVEHVPTIFYGPDSHHEQVVKLADMIGKTASFRSSESPTAVRVIQDWNVWKTSIGMYDPAISDEEALKTRDQLIYDIYDHTVDNPVGYYILKMSKAELERAKWEGLNAILTTAELGAFAMGAGPISTLARRGATKALGGFARNRMVAGVGGAIAQGAGLGMYGAGIHEARLGAFEGEPFDLDRFVENAGWIMAADLGFQGLAAMMPRSSVMLPEAGVQGNAFASTPRSTFRGVLNREGIAVREGAASAAGKTGNTTALQLAEDFRFPSLEAITTSQPGVARWWNGRYGTPASEPNAYWVSGKQVFPTRRNSGLRGDYLRQEQTLFTIQRLGSDRAFNVSLVYGQAHEAGLATVTGGLADRGAQNAVNRGIDYLKSIGVTIPF